MAEVWIKELLVKDILNQWQRPESTHPAPMPDPALALTDRPKVSAP